MEDPTKLGSSGNENKTEIKGNTTGGSPRGDFVAGTVLASRYRIINLVGKGGMGEVYKAEDIKLGQIVALKFLPDSYKEDSEALERFHAEVRNARQVSHLNVCRVFDIGEIEGRHFLSMEFVDGDDLSELLTRVGRFTHERAVEISRQLCVGMEAIHKAGILHRDFKPANIIIDKKGIARITDFGIAGVESEIAKDGIRAGTPAYMAPEQISGKEVSARSDIYALGLVIYEIFTGKQAFVADNVIDLIKKHRTETPTNPSEIVKGIDPLVESVIAQCLEKDPKNRPQSALHVAMALPGGNPLQIALDAGQTPSPEMVAAAPKKGTLRPSVAFALMITVFIAFGLGIGLSTRRTLENAVPLDKSPDVLRERSRELAEKFGYPPVDSYSEFAVFRGYVDYLKKNDQTQERWKKLASAQPAVLQFLYLASPEPIFTMSGGAPQWYDPPNNTPGMARLRVDTKGRLTYFEGVPPRVIEKGTSLGEFDWTPLFKEAGLDLAAFQPADPQWTPPQAYDDQRAFSGTYPGVPDIAIRIEAATLRSKLVYLEIVEPWTPPPGQTTAGSVGIIVPIFFVTLLLTMFVGSAWLAIRNIRLGRSDLKNAFRVAGLLLGLRVIIWLFSTHHVASLDEFMSFATAIEAAVTWAVLGGLMYLAFEPFLRKIAPERVIGWNRLLAGDWRDPLVGRDVLIGVAGYSLSVIVALFLVYFIPKWLGEPLSIASNDPAALGGISIFPSFLADSIGQALFMSFGIAFFMLFFGLILRWKWLGAVAVWLILATPFLTNSGTPYVESIVGILNAAVLVFVAFRFGVLATISFLLIDFLNGIPFTADLTTWYSGNFILVILLLSGLTIHGFYTSIAGAKLFGGKSLLGD